MINFIYKFVKFMTGRNGPDELFKFLFFVYFILLIVNLFLKSVIIFYIEFFILIYMIYRFFSKNINVRRKENEIYLKIKSSIKKPFNNTKDKEHIYKKCHKCNTTLRLPLPDKRGIKKAKCPTCGKSMKVLALRKQKVEIIL